MLVYLLLRVLLFYNKVISIFLKIIFFEFLKLI